MAFQTQRNLTLMFGGYDGTTMFADTWECDGQTWYRRLPPVSPPGRSSMQLAHDSVRDRVVLFGSDLSDTWEWDGTTWLNRTSTTLPPPRMSSVMAFDRKRGRCVLFGGVGGASLLADTWEWDGTVWRSCGIVLAPSARAGSAMAYDARGGRMVLFGGASRSGFQSDTWTWNGSDWARLTTPLSPTARAGHAMVYDGTRGRIVLFGGQDLSGPLSDTWELEGATWMRRFTALTPSARLFHAMAFDSTRGQVVMFGGMSGGPALQDTWTYEPLAKGLVAPYGAGCPCNAGQPLLEPGEASRPWVGGSATIDMIHVGRDPLRNHAFAFLGASDAVWGSRTLPYDLATIGMPGCAVLCDPLLVAELSYRGEPCEITLAIPSNPGLVGSSFFLQGLVAALRSNHLEICLSNACKFTVGSK